MPNEVPDPKVRPVLFALIDPQDKESLEDALQGIDCEILLVHSTAEMLHMMHTMFAKVVVYDISSNVSRHDVGWLHCVTLMETREIPPKVLVASRNPDEPLWAEVLNVGGFDVVHVPFETEEMKRVVESALK